MISSGNIPRGPYRATKLWNEVVRLFRAGMPVRKHRYMLKSFPNSFSASEAVDWLHSLLRVNKNFGPSVTRTQTIQLLKKFLKNHIIEDVHGKWGSEDFSDNNQLFRFHTELSPSKKLRTPLKQLNSENTNANVRKSKSFKDEMLLVKGGKKMNTMLTTGVAKDLFAQSTDTMGVGKMENLWKDSLVYRLKKVLHLAEINDIMPDIQAEHISYNTDKVGPSGVVTVDPADDIPCWILSAMKCLSNWPHSTDSGLPCYEGFEKDVFKAVVDYFHSFPEPLLTFTFYELFTTVLVRCELLDEMCTGATHTVAVQEKESLVRRDEISKIHKQLMQAQMRHENLALRRERSSRGKRKKQLVYDENVSSSEKNNNTSSRSIYMKNPVRSGLTGRNQFRSVQNLDVLNEVEMETMNSSYMKPSLSQQSIYVSNNNINTEFHQIVESESEMDNNNQFLAGDWATPNDPTLNGDVFSSVEDLLVNMSHTMRSELELNLMAEDAPPSVASALDGATQRSHDSWHPGPSALDGATQRSRDSWQLKKPRCSKEDTAPLLGEDSYTVMMPPVTTYEGRGVGMDMNYRSLPRNKQIKCVDTSLQTKQPYKSELYKCKSQSSIIARREVPPSPDPATQPADVNRIKTRLMRLPYVSESQSGSCLSRRNSMQHVRTYVNTQQWSRSHNNLSQLQPQSVAVDDSKRNNRKSWSHDTPVKSVASKIREFEVEPASPLSDALNLAKRQLSIIETNSKEQKHLQEAFQLCLLLLPPANRRKLHLLLRMMTKIISNPHLISIDDKISTRALLVDKFTDCVIRSSECDPMSRDLRERVFIFLLDHSSSVFIVHEGLKTEVLEKEKNVDVSTKIPEKLTHDKRKNLKRQYTFCKQVTNDEYERHVSETRQALVELLSGIVSNQNLDVKEKRKKLKQFQKSYPEIFRSRFPDGMPPLEVTKQRRQPLLTGALNRLRNLRASYVQFEGCDFSTSRVRHAWLGIIPLNGAISSKRSKRSVVTWTEIRISRQITQTGRMTVFYTKDGSALQGMQMVIPRCTER
uniref:DEP domain-containing protein 1A isoform X3 n=1 Tax=Ciona intestinalis TaxID=7719 RepID=UPI00006A539B|nr:DEP domain-containing protein 1A isoform X3 [Ciona intestinalis]|eukprot:XP_018667694.1 DEP domain-containing protein 1A isoform X3 [Ciona intestinalis]